MPTYFNDPVFKALPPEAKVVFLKEHEPLFQDLPAESKAMFLRKLPDFSALPLKEQGRILGEHGFIEKTPPSIEEQLAPMMESVKKIPTQGLSWTGASTGAGVGEVVPPPVTRIAREAANQAKEKTVSFLTPPVRLAGKGLQFLSTSATEQLTGSKPAALQWLGRMTRSVPIERIEAAIDTVRDKGIDNPWLAGYIAIMTTPLKVGIPAYKEFAALTLENLDSPGNIISMGMGATAGPALRTASKLILSGKVAEGAQIMKDVAKTLTAANVAKGVGESALSMVAPISAAPETLGSAVLGPITEKIGEGVAKAGSKVMVPAWGARTLRKGSFPTDLPIPNAPASVTQLTKEYLAPAGSALPEVGQTARVDYSIALAKAKEEALQYEKNMLPDMTPEQGAVAQRLIDGGVNPVLVEDIVKNPNQEFYKLKENKIVEVPGLERKAVEKTLYGASREKALGRAIKKDVNAMVSTEQSAEQLAARQKMEEIFASGSTRKLYEDQVGKIKPPVAGPIEVGGLPPAVTGAVNRPIEAVAPTLNINIAKSLGAQRAYWELKTPSAIRSTRPSAEAMEDLAKRLGHTPSMDELQSFQNSYKTVLDYNLESVDPMLAAQTAREPGAVEEARKWFNMAGELRQGLIDAGYSPEITEKLNGKWMGRFYAGNEIPMEMVPRLEAAIGSAPGAAKNISLREAQRLMERKDIPEDIRQALDEVTSIKYRAMKSILQERELIAFGKFQKALLDTGVPSAVPKPGWVRLTDTTRTIEGLKDKYIPLDWARELMYFQEEARMMRDPNTLRKLMRAWKEITVVYNLPVWSNNIMGNFLLADLQRMGTPITNPILWSSAAKEFITHGKKYQAAKAAGVFDEGIDMRAAVTKRLANLLLESVEDAKVGPAIAVDLIARTQKDGLFKSLLSATRQKARQAYLATDDIFRMRAFDYYTSTGMDVAQAAQLARRAFVDFSRTPVALRRLGASAFSPMPFVSWQYGATPILLKAMRDNPAALQRWTRMLDAWNTAAALEMGTTPDVVDKYREYKIAQQRSPLMKEFASNTPLLLIPHRVANGEFMIQDLFSGNPYGAMTSGRVATPSPLVSILLTGLTMSKMYGFKPIEPLGSLQDAAAEMVRYTNLPFPMASKAAKIGLLKLARDGGLGKDAYEWQKILATVFGDYELGTVTRKPQPISQQIMRSMGPYPKEVNLPFEYAATLRGIAQQKTANTADIRAEAKRKVIGLQNFAEMKAEHERR